MHVQQRIQTVDLRSLRVKVEQACAVRWHISLHREQVIDCTVGSFNFLSFGESQMTVRQRVLLTTGLVTAIAKEVKSLILHHYVVALKLIALSLEVALESTHPLLRVHELDHLSVGLLLRRCNRQGQVIQGIRMTVVLIDSFVDAAFALF